jgi:hypothetical protein
MTDEAIVNSVIDSTDETNTNINETVEQVNENPSEQTSEQVATEKPVEQVSTPAVTPKTYSEDEYNQMLYSMKRQLGKSKDKYESQIANYEKRFSDFENKLNGILNPEKPLRRDDFKTDDEFIEKLIENGVEKRWAEKEKLMREEYEKYEAQQKEEYEHRKELDEGINKWWPTADERKKFVDTVQNAYDKGLSKLLEEEQNVMNYLHQTPNQSLVLYELATNPNAVQEIFSIKNPLMRMIAVGKMEDRLVAERNAQKPQVAPQQTQVLEQPATTEQKPINNLSKPVGKPGTQVDAEPDMFSNEDSLLSFIRGN